MPEKTPDEPNLPAWIYQPAKISLILLVMKYPCAENPKKKRSGLKHASEKKGRGTMQKEHAKNVKQPDIIEPVTTLLDEGKLIYIVTKLPGIAEEKIRIDIDLEKTTITIIAADTTKMYKKVITLPGNVVFSNKRFSDGELLLVVEKKGS
jgi:HSP20 family molecular chaperone IbpA